MTKQEQFIAIVQTMFLANAINLSLEADARDRRHIFSASGAFSFMDDAIEASERIPDDMSARDAANSFASWEFENLREEGGSVPAWFARA